MGLDTTHGCWHGAYSSFYRWRTELARLGGYPERDDRGYALDWELFEGKNFEGEWDQTPEDPLLILLVHSDCDGRIEAAHAPFLAGRLEGLLPQLRELPDDGGHIGVWSDKTQAFIDGLRAAAAAGEDVEFW